MTGPPGSGKTTISELLAAGSTAPSVHLRADSFYDWIRSGFIPPDRPDAQAQNTTVLSAVAEAALAYWRGGYEVIVDGIIGPWFLPQLYSAFVAANAPCAYIIIRAAEQIAVERAIARDPAEAARLMSTIRALHNAFADVGNHEQNVIDTTTTSPEQSARDIREGLSCKRF